METFLTSFHLFLLGLLQVKLLLLLAEPSIQIDSYELCLLQKGDQVLTGQCLYLDRSGIYSKKFQRVHHEPFGQVFSFL